MPERQSLLRRGEWHAAARALKAANSDMTYSEIGRRLGVTNSAVLKVLNPARASAYNKRGNAGQERQARKNAWESVHRYKPCPSCGSDMYRASDQCEGCLKATETVRRTLCEGMWADGWTCGEIAKILGVDARTLTSRRKHGWDLPHRRTPEQIERMRAARWGASDPSPFYRAEAA